MTYVFSALKTENFEETSAVKDTRINKKKPTNESRHKKRIKMSS